MNTRIILALLLSAVAASLPAKAQLMNGQWREHLSYNNVRQIIEAKNRIYCATDGGIFFLDKADNTLTKVSKINGLTDVNIRSFAWDSISDIFIIAYDNSNIDIVDKGKVYNMPDILNKQISAKKTIYSIAIHNRLAYLACGFGVVVLDYQRKEFSDTYIFGPQANYIEVYDIAFTADSLYAATTQGLYSASQSEPNLVDYSKWREIAVEGFSGRSVRFVEATNNEVFTYGESMLRKYSNGSWKNVRRFWNSVFSVSLIADSIYVAVIDRLYAMDKNGNVGFAADGKNNTFFMADSEGTYWIGGNPFGLGRLTETGEIFYSIPDGPAFNIPFFISIYNSSVWVGAGNDQIPWTYRGGSNLESGKWSNYTRYTIDGLDNVMNFGRIAIDPANPRHVFASSIRQGLIELLDGEVLNFYRDTNSILESIPNYPQDTRIMGMRYDNQGNLWMAAALNNRPFYVIPPNGSIKKLAYTMEPSHMNDLWPMSNGQKWVCCAAEGLLVFTDNNTPLDDSDDQFRRFGISDTEESAISVYTNTCAEDLEGNMWVCTRNGVLVYYNSYEVFDGTSTQFPGVRPKIPRNDGTDLADYLLDGENITAMAVDRGNRKWFGTSGSGVFLISPDGTEEILHFTKENSSLISNYINDIVINHQTGEVYFSTEAG